MTSRRGIRWIAALGLGLAIAGQRDARGQFGGARYPSVGQFGAGVPSSGYGIRTGQVGTGYQGAYGIYRQAYAAPRAQTTIALQPLYSAITSLPGWNGPTRRFHHRARYARSDDPPFPHYDRNGKILWPSTIHDDPSSAGLRQAAEAAFRAIVRESKSTGHASIRPVIDAKQKLSAYERKVLPAIKGRSVTEGDDLERFFVDLDRSLDRMNSLFL